jgi:hypothetical protein
VEPVDRRHVLGLVLHLALERLQHDVREVDADDVQPVGRQLVHLRPHEATARAGLVLDDGLDGRAAALQHDLLVARRDVGLAARRERLPVVEILLGTGLREGDARKQKKNREKPQHGNAPLDDQRRF